MLTQNFISRQNKIGTYVAVKIKSFVVEIILKFTLPIKSKSPVQFLAAE